MSTTTVQSSPSAETVTDIFLWRRKKLSVMVLLVATATWVALEVYELNFATVASWVAMFIVVSAFLWGNVRRLLNRDPPNLSELEITEQSAMEMANIFRALVEEGIRRMFRVAAEGNLFVFTGVETGLWLLSLAGSVSELLSLLYIGIVMGMTVPVIYIKNEARIKRWVERLRKQGQKVYCAIDEKVLRKIKGKVAGDAKEKKTE